MAERLRKWIESEFMSGDARLPRNITARSHDIESVLRQASRRFNVSDYLRIQRWNTEIADSKFHASSGAANGAGQIRVLEPSNTRQHFSKWPEVISFGLRSTLWHAWRADTSRGPLATSRSAGRIDVSIAAMSKTQACSQLRRAW